MRALALAVLLLLSACTAPAAPAGKAPAATSYPTASRGGSPAPATPGVPAPSATCTGGPGASMALIGGTLYDAPAAFWPNS